jgi:hypothetical protein
MNIKIIFIWEGVFLLVKDVLKEFYSNVRLYNLIEQMIEDAGNYLNFAELNFNNSVLDTAFR